MFSVKALDNVKEHKMSFYHFVAIVIYLVGVNAAIQAQKFVSDKISFYRRLVEKIFKSAQQETSKI